MKANISFVEDIYHLDEGHKITIYCDSREDVNCVVCGLQEKFVLTNLYIKDDSNADNSSGRT